MLKTEIDENEPLFPGDVILMTFQTYGSSWIYLRASELCVLKWQLSRKHPYWRMTAWDSTTYPDKLIIEFLIKEPPTDEVPQVQQASVITPLIIAAIVIGGGLFAWLSLVKVEKIVDSPAGKLALAGTGSLGVAALVIAVLLLLRHYQD